MFGTIIDQISVSGEIAMKYGAAGVIIVFEADDQRASPQAGDQAVLARPDGWMKQVTLGEVRTHSPRGRSCFVANLDTRDVPDGTRITWPQALVVASAGDAEPRIAARG
jgi:hypothetical protein